MRALAWLNAVPEAPKGAGNLSERKAPGERKSRMQLAREKNDMPDLPVVEAGQYLVGYLLDIGPVISNGMGLNQISHQEIAAWEHLGGIALLPWEARLLRRLSGEYAGEAGRATAADCPPPWLDTPDERDREMIANNLRDSFSALMQARIHK